MSREAMKQEPVAWVSHIPTRKVNGKQLHWTKEQALKWSSDITPLYAAPKQWVGLTDEELKPLCDENHIMFGAYTVDFIQAIEAKLKEKNT